MQMDAVAQLLAEKGIVTEHERYNKLKEITFEYREKLGDR
jgi:hypothetical protein